jgi:hypothetical protein
MIEHIPGETNIWAEILLRWPHSTKEGWLSSITGPKGLADSLLQKDFVWPSLVC